MTTEVLEQPPAAPVARTSGTDLRPPAVVIVVLALLGVVLGFVWSAWSGPQQRAYVIGPGKLYPFDEVETMAAADGRYLVLVAVAGIVAGVAAWGALRAHRGPLVAAALAAGGLAGAALTWWIGYLSGGGTYDGRTGSIIAHLPLSLRMHGLLFLEPALALLGYGLLAAFAVRDDLGRPEAPGSSSVQGGGHAYGRRGHGDAPGPGEQADLAP
jgi:hypothetical protein